MKGWWLSHTHIHAHTQTLSHNQTQRGGGWGRLLSVYHLQYVREGAERRWIFNTITDRFALKSEWFLCSGLYCSSQQCQSSREMFRVEEDILFNHLSPRVLLSDPMTTIYYLHWWVKPCLATYLLYGKDKQVISLYFQLLTNSSITFRKSNPPFDKHSLFFLQASINTYRHTDKHKYIHTYRQTYISKIYSKVYYSWQLY